MVQLSLLFSLVPGLAVVTPNGQLIFNTAAHLVHRQFSSGCCSWGIFSCSYERECVSRSHRRSKDFPRRCMWPRGSAVQGLQGPIVSKGVLIVIALGPRSAPAGAQLGWLVLVGAPTLQKSAFGCRKPCMCREKIPMVTPDRRVGGHRGGGGLSLTMHWHLLPPGFVPGRSSFYIALQWLCQHFYARTCDLFTRCRESRHPNMCSYEIWE